jgi:hypothetical protein
MLGRSCELGAFSLHWRPRHSDRGAAGRQGAVWGSYAEEKVNSGYPSELRWHRDEGHDWKLGLRGGPERGPSRLRHCGSLHFHRTTSSICWRDIKILGWDGWAEDVTLSRMADMEQTSEDAAMRPATKYRGSRIPRGLPNH